MWAGYDVHWNAMNRIPHIKKNQWFACKAIFCNKYYLDDKTA